VQIAQPTNVSVPFQELVFRDIRIHGSLTSEYSQVMFQVQMLMEIGSRGECLKMLDVVSKNNIKVKTNPFNGIQEVPKAIELAHSGKMQGKPVIIIDQEAIGKEKKSGVKMV
jgi:alcohol dehydrogenase, propanol-preferring